MTQPGGGEFPHLPDDEIRTEALRLLGNNRVMPFSAFNSEEFLLARSEEYHKSPSMLMIRNSQIKGGNEILINHLFEYAISQADLPLDNDYASKKANYMNEWFRYGFGVVESPMVENLVSSADPEFISINAYNEWCRKPLEDRLEEMRRYLANQGAPLLAIYLLDREMPGSIMSVAEHTKIKANLGKGSFEANAVNNPEAQIMLQEGALAAMFLLREHHTAQTLSDMESGSDMERELIGMLATDQDENPGDSSDS